MESSHQLGLNRSDSFEERALAAIVEAEGPEQLLASTVAEGPLLGCCAARSPQLLLQLLRRGVDPNHPLAGFPLHAAVAQQLGLDPPSGRGPSGLRRALKHSVGRGGEGLVRTLLNFGADPNLSDGTSSPMELVIHRFEAQFAADEAPGRMVEAMLDGSGIPPSGSPERTAYSTLQLLVENGGRLPSAEWEQAMAPVLAAAVEQQRLFLAAAESGDLEAVLKAVRFEGVLVNYADPDGHTALWFAVLARQQPVVRGLLEMGAYTGVQVASGNRFTPIHQLCAEPPSGFDELVGTVEMLELLLSESGYLEAVDSEGRTALELALQCGFLIGCELLLRAGARCDWSRLDGVSRQQTEQALAGHREAVKLQRQQEKQANEQAAREKQLAWDLEVCKNELIGMGYSTALAQKAIDAVGRSDVAECIDWISAKQARDEEERRARRQRELAEQRAREAAEEAENAAMIANEDDGSASEPEEEDDRDGWWDDDEDEEDDGIDWEAADKQPEQEPKLMRYKSFVQHEISDIPQKRRELILEAKKLLNDVSTTVVANLLADYTWNAQNLIRDWFTGKGREQILAECGLSDMEMLELSLPEGVTECEIMASAGCTEYLDEDEYNKFLENPGAELIHIPCGHTGCRACWAECLTNAIVNGNVTELRCPNCLCNSASDSSILPPVVSEDMIQSLVAPEVYNKFERFLIKNFVDTQKTTYKWCPHPECRFVVDGSQSQSIKQHSRKGQSLELCVGMDTSSAGGALASRMRQSHVRTSKIGRRAQQMLMGMLQTSGFFSTRKSAPSVAIGSRKMQAVITWCAANTLTVAKSVPLGVATPSVGSARDLMTIMTTPHANE